MNPAGHNCGNRHILVIITQIGQMINDHKNIRFYQGYFSKFDRSVMH